MAALDCGRGARVNRRGLLLGLLAAPLVVRSPGLLMPVKPVPVGLPASFALEDVVVEFRSPFPPFRVVLMMDGRAIGLNQSARLAHSYALEDASGIGDIHVIEHVETQVT